METTTRDQQVKAVHLNSGRFAKARSLYIDSVGKHVEQCMLSHPFCVQIKLRKGETM